MVEFPHLYEKKIEEERDCIFQNYNVVVFLVLKLTWRISFIGRVRSLCGTKTKVHVNDS